MKGVTVVLDDLPPGTGKPKVWECTACTGLVKHPNRHLTECPAATATSPIDLSDLRASLCT